MFQESRANQVIGEIIIKNEDVSQYIFVNDWQDGSITVEQRDSEIVLDFSQAKELIKSLQEIVE